MLINSLLHLHYITYTPNVNNVSPIHINIAAVKSKGPYRFPCIRILPIKTGINLQLLKITCVG